MASSDNTKATESKHEYPFPCHLHAAVSFVSIKLSGKHNYAGWREQMVCLLKCHDMYGFIDGTTFPEPLVYEWRRSDALVKGWIFGSLSEDVMSTVVGLQTSYDVWKRLETCYNTTTTHTAPMRIVTTNTGKKSVGAYFPLCTAIQLRDWSTTERLLAEDNEALTDILNVDGDTALHLAIGEPSSTYSYRHWRFLNKLLKRIDPETLPRLVNYKQQNALHYAAMLDDNMAARELVMKNPYLLFKADCDKFLPVTRAAFHSHKGMFLYLLDECKNHVFCEGDGCVDPFVGETGSLLLSNTICSGFLDAAYALLKDHPELALIKLPGTMGPLWCISQIWDAYPSGERYNLYQRFLYDHITGNSHRIYSNHLMRMKTYMPRIVFEFMRSVFRVFAWIHDKFWIFLALHVPHMKHIHKDKVKHNTAFMILNRICDEVSRLKLGTSEHYEDAFLAAMENDTPEVIHMIIKTFPQSMWIGDANGHTLSQMSIKNRCEKVYNVLVHDVTPQKFPHNSIIDKEGNNLLHLAGQLAPPHKLNKVTGAALQMQRELQWFQEVRKLLRPEEREKRNQNKETPMMVFRKEHKDLRQKGEEWMKKTADSYTITAALIITIVFAAAITVPGGNNGDTGQAIYRKSSSFIIFVVSDAISLFTSTTSLLLFLSILTARYADEDFLYKLPKRLMFGLVMLFMSVTTMMIAFGATLYIMFEQDKPWVLIPIAALTCLPIASFVTLQLPLLVDLISSTYGHGIFGKRELEIEAKRVRRLLSLKTVSSGMPFVYPSNAHLDTTFQRGLLRSVGLDAHKQDALVKRLERVCFGGEGGWGSIVYSSLD